MTTEKEVNFAIPKCGETFVGEDGTVSQVLDDVVDENYEPVQEEIEDYAEWLGMKLPEDNMFLWIAQEGLKAQLPPEWKPCRTNDDEIYYFNFKTGESTWKHPMDTIYQNKFKEAKAQQKKNQSTSSIGNAPKKTTSIGSQGNSATQSQSQQKPPVWGQGAAKKTKEDANFMHSTKTDLNKRIGEVAMAHQVPEAKHLKVSLSEQNTVPSTALFTSGSPTSALTVSSFGNESTPVLLAASQTRLVSESESALEESIRAQLKESFEAEKLKMQNLQKTTLEAMRKQHEEELREIQEEEDRRYGVDEDAGVEVDTGDEFRAHNIAEARAYLEKKYGSCLSELEKESKSLDVQLKELRLKKSSNEDLVYRNRFEVEREVAVEKENMIAAMELEVENYLRDKKNELDALYQTKSDVIKKSAETGLERARQTSDRLFRQKEAHVLASMEMTRKRLEMEKKKIEASVRNMTNVFSFVHKASAFRAAEGDEGDSAVLKGIITQRDTACAELHAKAFQEQDALRKEEDALLASLRSQLAEKTLSCSTAIQEGSAEKIEKRISDDLSHFSDTAVDFVDSSAEYRTQLAALRAKYAEEKEKALANLAKEREAKLEALRTENAKLSQSPASCVATHPIATEATPDDSLIQALKEQHMKKLWSLKACYASLEKDFSKCLAMELTNTRARGPEWQANDGVQEAVDTDMDLHIRQVSAFRERLSDEVDTCKAKIQIESKPNREQMLGDLCKAVTIPAEVSEAEEKEKVVLAEHTKVALERRRLQYLQEERSLREEIDNEMEAYFAAEKEKLLTKATDVSVFPANPSGDALDLEKLLSERNDLLLSQQEELTQLQATLEEKRRKVHELKEVLAKEAVTESPNDSSGLAPQTSAYISKDLHEARMAALEETYREQEAILQREVAECSKRRAAAIHEGVSSSILKTPQNMLRGRSACYSQAVSQSTEPAAADELAVWPQLMTNVRDFQVSDALQYWKGQREYVAEIHRDLESLRQRHCTPEVSTTRREPLESHSMLASALLAPSSASPFYEPLRRAQSAEVLDSHPLQTTRSSDFLTVSIDGLNSRLSKLVSTVTAQRHMSRKKEWKPQSTPTNADALKKKWDCALQKYLSSITEASDEQF